VRDNVPISIQEWNKPKVGTSYVDSRSKDFLWDTLKSHFTLPPECDELKVKDWALKKMATQFQTFKKRLYADYIKENKTPTFTGALEKIKDHWPAFVAYKNSSLSARRSEVNKENAKKKIYHHVLGTGGYKSAVQKWEKAEAALIEKGITPGTSDWPLRSKQWFYAHGGRLDPETGKVTIAKDQIKEVAQELAKAIKHAREGKYKPERENDELTRALGNPEHGGRTRGKGLVPWKIGFSEYNESYRSRERKKKQLADRFQRLEKKNEELERMLKRQQEQLDIVLSGQQGASQRQIILPEFDITGQSQRRSSVASTGVRSDEDVQKDEAPTARCPVDDISERTNCHLIQIMKNISLKVAVGCALPSGPGACIHGRPIPAGYARVGVDEVMKGYETLHLDIPVGEDGEITTLGEATHGIILWRKECIVLPNSAPRPPPSPERHPTPPSSPARDPTPPSSPAREPTPPSSPARGPTPPSSPAREPTPPSQSPARQLTPPPPSPARQPTPPPPTKFQGQKRKYIAPSTYSSTARKKGTTKQLKPLPKLPGEMTYEENKAISDAETKAFFARMKNQRHPPPKEKIPVSISQNFVNMYDQPPAHVANRPSDYDRCIEKTYCKAKRSGKTIPQLGEQKKKSISPLKVLPLLDEYEVIAKSLGLSVDQLLNKEAIPMAELAWKFVLGEPLVRPEQIPHLPTQMRILHDWYMEVTKKDRKMLLMKFRTEHYFREGEIIIEFDELFQIFNQQALDKSILSSYCL